MSFFKSYKRLALILMVVVVLFGLGSFIQIKQPEQNQGIPLAQPLFLDEVKASNSALDIVN